LGIVGLFAIKYVEERRQKIVLSPLLRAKANERAIRLKALLLVKRAEVSRLPSTFLHLTHRGVHFAALEAARFARFIEAQAHRLADFVSHKHHFKKTETRSEFLKQVSEHPIRDSRSNGAGKYGSSSANSSQNDNERL
ncbi:MAG: hypothetical protein AAB899_00145, partial [Patescibacteria group bacterium]